MRWAWVLLLAASLALVGGCVGDDAETSVAEAPEGTEDSDPDDEGSRTSDRDASSGANRSASSANASEANGAVDPGWPPVEEASIRPGVAIDDASCTAAFVLSSPDNATLYLVTAGHCFGDAEPGANVSIAGQEGGTLVFKQNAAPPEDFALVEVPDKLRPEVHPSIRHYGGPTGVSGGTEAGDKLLTFGRSGVRNPGGSEPGDRLDPREGYTLEDRGSTTAAQLPALPGDSGSPVITGQGEAVGIVSQGRVGVSVPPCAGCTILVDLDDRLDVAAEEGLELELKTWSQQASGRLPATR